MINLPVYMSFTELFCRRYSTFIIPTVTEHDRASLSRSASFFASVSNHVGTCREKKKDAFVLLTLLFFLRIDVVPDLKGEEKKKG